MINSLVIALLAVAGGGSSSETIKSRFLEDYRKAVVASETRLSRNIELDVHGRAFDHSDKVTGESHTTYRSNDTCMLVKELISPGNHLSWYLLRPEGTFRIAESSTKPGEYLLKSFTPGSFSVTEAGPPFFGPVFPMIRVTLSLRDHIASDNVVVIKDETNGQIRTLTVKETIGQSQCNTTYAFRTGDLLLDEFFGTDQTGVPFRFKFFYNEVGGQVYPSRLERYLGPPNGEMRRIGIAEYSSYRPASIPDPEFSLSRFGLPDAVGVPSPSKTPLYVWLLLGTLCCVLVAYVAQALRRRCIVGQGLSQ